MKVNEVSDISGNIESELNSILDEKAVSPGYIDESQYLLQKIVGKYKLTKNLGSGGTSKVKLGINNETGEKVAIKIVSKKMSTSSLGKDTEAKRDERIYREVLISTLLNHPHIVRLKDFYYNENNFFLVFEYIKGKQLLDLVARNGALSENDSRRFFRQILSAVGYIHNNSIVHRDLKIENILIDDDGNAKILDFGLSNFYDNKRLLNTFCGSLYFAAPELLMGRQYSGPEIDIWSLGIILYVMLCGKVPFDDKDVHALHSKIKKASLTFVKSLSSEAEELLSGMILPTPSSRLGMDQIVKSVWVNKDYKTNVDFFNNRKFLLKRLRTGYLKLISYVVRSQFPDMEKDVRRYISICKEGKSESLEQIYWARRPTISLYYLFIEAVGLNEDLIEITEDKIDESDISDELCLGTEEDRPQMYHNFVSFVFSKEKNNSFSKYFTGSIFLNSESSLNHIEKTVLGDTSNIDNLPAIKNTYLKGFFKGIKIKPTLSHTEIKKILIQFFTAMKITYEIKEKNYKLIYDINETKCEFKISLYFNKLFKEHFLSVTRLSGDKKLFRDVLVSLAGIFK
ncbi:Kin1-like serine/threonine-protein kinase [Hamiltosporidium magnivora]|uniref:non-specific serine/threonine protein kinase n=1 Tax=Hamiltosporidium magnivora TaxID=148818 RepID=A0A4Q9LLQ4_9MICR|nr:Kin1-like serine/threonine-protein kinase [Hamiltosporidium magnivora]